MAQLTDRLRSLLRKAWRYLPNLRRPLIFILLLSLVVVADLTIAIAVWRPLGIFIFPLGLWMIIRYFHKIR